MENSTPFRVVVVDDEEPARTRLIELIQSHPQLELTASCANGADAVLAIRQTAPDLVFLDVQMPVIDGFQVIESLDPEARPAIVFVTAYDKYAVAAFEENAVDYIVKPFDDARFLKCVERVWARRAPRDGVADRTLYRSHVIVRSGKTREIISVNDVDWLEAADNYIRLHTRGKTRLLRGTISSIADTLDPDAFLRIHRSTIVNRRRIKTIAPFNQTEFEVTLIDGTRLRSSRAYRTEVRSFMKALHEGC